MSWRQIIAAAVVVLLVYLAVIIFSPLMALDTTFPTNLPRRQSQPPGRADVTIDVDGTAVRAWLYLPYAATERVPYVVLSTGLGGTKDAVVEPFAIEFARNGIAALTYDYRFCGTSGGAPRQLINGVQQQEDLRAVVAYARTRAEIDPERIVLWSTSSAGGYGINLAARDPRIAGVIAQAASLDHAKDDRIVLRREGIGYMLKLFMHEQRDKGRARFGLSPHLIPIVSKPGTFALLTAPGAWEGYVRVMAESEGFVNGFCARGMLMVQGPDARKCARDVHCPVLIQVCAHDTLVAADSHATVARVLGEQATVIHYPAGHFDHYDGDLFRQVVEAQTAFIRQLRA